MSKQQQQQPLDNPASEIPTPATKPTSALAHHRILAPSAEIRVSPLCLGAANFGDAWKEFMGECKKETAFEMMVIAHLLA